jgi:hypothetical protein
VLLATILLLCPFPQSGEVAKAVVANHPTAVSDEASKESSSRSALPTAPEPKLKGENEAANAAEAAPVLDASGQLAAPAGPIVPGSVALPPLPAKPAFYRSYETARQRKLWYGLVIAGHSAAAFDAWSTRRAISGGYGTEANPLLRPFANSGALYAATQVSPAVMDFLGKRMMTSRHPWVRRMWWVPQTAGFGFSVAAGVHNVGVVP